MTHAAQPPSPAIGEDTESSSTPPPVSGPSRRTRTHWTTGSPSPARHATRPVPDLAGERQPGRRRVGQHLHPPGPAQPGDALAGRLRAGRLAAAGRQQGEHGGGVAARLGAHELEHVRALRAAARQAAGEQHREAEEDEQAEEDRDEHSGAAHGPRGT